jgi:hypothetical protein
MKSNVTKYSAAAAVAIALVLLNPFGWLKHSGVLLAGVQKKIAQTDTMVFRGQKIFWCVNEPNLTLKFDTVKYFSKAYGHTEEGYLCGKLAYRFTVNLPEKQTLVVFPTLQKYLMCPSTKGQINLVEKLTQLTPAGMIDVFLQADYKELGVSDINGVEVEGFEFHDLKAVENILPKSVLEMVQLRLDKGILWVAVKELLPVKIEGDMILGPTIFTLFTECRLHEFLVLENYDIELGPEIFSTDIPEGFTEIRITDFIPFKLGLAGIGLTFIPIGLIVRKKMRMRKIQQ